ncbi:hypothetical protein [Nocardia sp. alder85J]|uniref:hypothetical protein n=1 Tax=Nocardia sp. alder85J TaxID=2862949 RepID=UPI001CD1B04E|nr:hypothetical protein [Nocardia sp. alder85J]MCX4091384.1 hypothetical protein [Nocardia sp. alder85J]
MRSRDVHFVGSFPAASTADAMGAMADCAGPLLRTLPTGEVRRYEYYIRPILEDLVAQGALEVAKAGEWRTLRDLPRYRVPQGKTLSGEVMDLGYGREAAEAMPVFAAVRDARDLPELRLQVGMPTDLSLAFIALGVRGVRSQRAAFAAATGREIAAIAQSAGTEVVVQLEATAELVSMALAQPFQRSLDRRLGLGRGIAGLAAAAPEGTRFGVHLCVGSLHNKGVPLRSARPLVDLANSVARQWPAGRTLEYVHAPFAAGGRPPATGERFYAPLADLALPAGTRFHAGFVHDSPTEAQQRKTLQSIENALGRRVDGVACACGLGRRSRPVADALMARAVALAGC